MVSPTSLVSLWLLAGLMLSIAGTSDATNLLKRPSTKGERKKGWRRRAQNWASANESSQQGSVTSTIVTNPSTLKGKGGGSTVVYDEEDDSGRTTFVVNCKQAKALTSDEAGVKAGEIIAVKASGKAGGASEAASGSGVKAPKTVPNDICDEAVGDDADTNTDDGDGTWNDGGDSESQTGSDAESGTGTDSESEGYPPPDNSQQVSGSVSGPPPCVDIAAGAGPFGDNKIDYNVSLEVVKQADLPSEGILRLMRADLQYNVAPVIADCTDGSETNSNGAGDTNITDVRFNELVEDTTGLCPVLC
jgi:hypothetical protein